MPVGRSLSIWNFLESIRKGVEFLGVTNKEVHRVSRGPFVGLGRDVTLLFRIGLTRSFISMTNLETSVDYLLFWNRPLIDR